MHNILTCLRMRVRAGASASRMRRDCAAAATVPEPERRTCPQLGFLTACLPGRGLKENAAWAAQEGFEALEGAAWPALGDRPFTATHLDVDGFGPADADRVRDLFGRHGLTLSSLAYYDYNLLPVADERSAVNAHVAACIDAASLLGVPAGGAGGGRGPGRT